MNNPLRYPGAKSKLTKYITNLLNSEGLSGCTFYEPYGGSAALSFNLLEKKVVKKAVINEKDPLIFCFWYCVLYYTEELIHMIETTEISIDNWFKYCQYRDINFIKNKTILDIGFAGLFLNRTNFSGILKAGPIGGKLQKSQYKIDCRFNKKVLIQIIRDCAEYRDFIKLYNLDAIDFMKTRIKYKNNSTIFVYIDPPYYAKGQSLYRYYYDNSQHEKLYNYIKNKVYPWIISYDDHPFIEKLYSSNNRIKFYLDYSVRNAKKGTELLISNLEIPPIENFDSNYIFKVN